MIAFALINFVIIMLGFHAILAASNRIVAGREGTGKESNEW